jgi:hypothetical protein
MLKTKDKFHELDKDHSDHYQFSRSLKKLTGNLILVIVSIFIGFYYGKKYSLLYEFLTENKYSYIFLYCFIFGVACFISMKYIFKFLKLILELNHSVYGLIISFIIVYIALYNMLPKPDDFDLYLSLIGFTFLIVSVSGIFINIPFIIYFTCESDFDEATTITGLIIFWALPFLLIFFTLSDSSLSDSSLIYLSPIFFPLLLFDDPNGLYKYLFK